MHLVMSGEKIKQTWFKDVIFYHEYVWENVKNPRKIILSNSHFWPCKMLYAAAAAKSLQSCPTLCDPIDRSPPGSPVPGILQARTLEWVAISLPLIQAQVMRERVPASAVRHERLTMEYPWPLSASQQSWELGSSVSSNSPQRFLLRGACWVCKDTKMEVPEGRVSSKVLGCQRNEYIKWLWKKWWKRSTL